MNKEPKIVSGIPLIWLRDPKTNKASVSLTNLVISIIFLLVASGLNLAGKTKDTSIATDYFGLSAALYFSRKFNLKGKSYNPDGTSEDIIPEYPINPQNIP